ncbi:hypothetical protein H112_03243 [Trichophyton rubrum D6]|uniref:Uncharacterized protein n=4 Tax=Trichophyton TaxID=5550 RepID=A0A178EW16_TRIRU|nr:uncharacterized protein TERG_05851 [Trichophyton rubrum CBS 118892]EZF24206.1 hypothetical protein H100_03247 [Trichophyton rubrum MR850]EZF43247.1 hypothetical protein H102_03240 [Trichophyton rubrum CBS 100081]EZF53859.1 hypothetical protein H103_03255 [Trichophyton rubrum CBS 288.86]EZF64507.1 hypothetical protein H104_03238 [Trichophyton rubrum CBS 289.86]EZF75134.1 hypothetical protein H105_03258 [Trichophyton soudanense CBS 452.61]EZF85800.1 hypothetical protein H110_03247 [Trichophy
MDENMIQNIEHVIPWLLEPIISPRSIITAITVFAALLFMLGFRSGISFEGLFDTLHIYWVSNKIRKTKELFQTKSQIQKQTDWVEEWEYLDEEREFLRQRDYFLRETFLDYAAKDKLDELDGLDNFGPKLWEDKLADSKARLWLNEQKHVELTGSRPEGPKIRSWVMESDRIKRMVSKIGLPRYLAQEKFVKPCKENGGCCATDCGCCSKPRDVTPSGEVFYAHCTSLCLCCIRRRGFVRLVPTWRDVPGFVGFTDEDRIAQEAKKYLPESPAVQQTVEGTEKETSAYQSQVQDFDETVDGSVDNRPQ